MNHFFQFHACSSISVSVLLDAYIFVGRNREFCIFVFAYGNEDVVLELFFFFIIYLKDFPTSLHINLTHFSTSTMYSTTILIYLFPLFGHFDCFEFFVVVFLFLPQASLQQMSLYMYLCAHAYIFVQIFLGHMPKVELMS